MKWELEALKILTRNPTVPGIALQDAISEIEKLQKQLSGSPGDVCHWTYEGWYNDGGAWNTDCGECWQFTDGEGPTVNRVKFCHHCGKPMVEVIPPEEEEE